MELQHHGIKGMRWGVRRFQKKDGTLTPSGKKRYGQDNSVIKKDTDRGPDPKTIDDFGIRAVHAARRFYENPNGEDGELGPNTMKLYKEVTRGANAIASEYYSKYNLDDYSPDFDKKHYDEYQTARQKYYEKAYSNGALMKAQLKDIGVKDVESSYKKAKELGISDILDLSYKYWDDHWNDEDYAEHSALCHHGIKGMRWGVRRYRTKDGYLTKAGQRRYMKDRSDNPQGKKKQKNGEIVKANPDKWVTEDIERTKQLADATKHMNQELSTAVNRKSRKTNPRIDLSQMSDKELREKINREFMERQYNDLMNPVKVSKGKEFMQHALEVTGTVLGVTSSALGIALAVRDLMGKGK